MLVRYPATESNPLGKRTAIKSIDKWYIGIKLEADNGISRDLYNRAGMVTTTGVDCAVFNAIDLLPPDGYVNVCLINPDGSGNHLAYDYRAAGDEEYQWEINLSTTYSSIAAHLSFDNFSGIPSNVNLSLKDMSTGETTVLESDRSIPITLNSGSQKKFLLTATIEITGIKEKPLSFGIRSVSPNPFNPVTRIGFEIEKPGNVRIRVYSVTGQLIDTLHNSPMSPGRHNISWDAGKHSSGVYFIRIENNGRKDVKAVTMVK
jgi:hypothetical protein